MTAARQRRRRECACGVARVHTRFLHVLHHATDEHLAGRVADRVDVDLDGVLEETVDQHGALGREPSLASEAPLVGELGHRAGAARRRRRRSASPGHRARRTGGRARDSRRAPRPASAASIDVAVPPGGWGISRSRAERVPLLAVLGAVDRLGARAHDEPRREHPRQLQRRLPAEGHDHPDRLLGLEHVEHVLAREGLEVEAVARVVVGRHRLGVAVDHDGLVAGLAQHEGRVHAAVVELDALPDAVGSRAEDDDPRLLGGADLVLVLVRAVVIRGARSELGATGVDGLEGDRDAVGQPRRSHLFLGHAEQMGELAVGETETLRPLPRAAIHALEAELFEPRPLVGDAGDLIEEPRIDAGRFGERLDRRTLAQRGLDVERPLGRGHRAARHEVVERDALVGGLARVGVEPEPPGLERAESPSGVTRRTCGRWPWPRRPTASACRAHRSCPEASRTPTAAPSSRRSRWSARSWPGSSA